MESFERPRAYIVPEAVDAYLSTDQERLRAWSSTKVLDIRHVDVSAGKVLEDEIPVPVFAILFATREVPLFRNVASGQVVVGTEDRVEQCMYAAVIKHTPEELDSELTGDRKVIAMACRSGRAYL